MLGWKISSNGILRTTIWGEKRQVIGQQKWDSHKVKLSIRSFDAKDQRRQGLTSHSADVNGMQAEKATGCYTECEDGPPYES